MKFPFPSTSVKPSDDDHISYSYLRVMLAEAAAAILHGGFTHYYEPFMIFFFVSFRLFISCYSCVPVLVIMLFFLR